jgi:hypothetical protein
MAEVSSDHVDLPPSRDCRLHLPGHNPHWIQVLKVAPNRGHVFGALNAELDPDRPGQWLFRFRADLTLAHTLPDKDCIAVALFNHDPQRLMAALEALDQVGRWIPGVRIFQLQHPGGWYTFDLSAEPVGPCQPG